MITAKNIYGSKAYKQLRVYADGDEALLKQLVEQFVSNSNTQRPERHVFRRTLDLCGSFLWSRTPEGQTFWGPMHDMTEGQD